MTGTTTLQCATSLIKVVCESLASDLSHVLPALRTSSNYMHSVFEYAQLVINVNTSHQTVDRALTS